VDKRSDAKYIEEICKATWESLYRFIYYKVQNREEAEDVTQETYVRALAYLNEHNFSDKNFQGFLRTIALNVIRDRWRQRKRRGLPLNFEEVNPRETVTEDHQRDVAQRLVIENALAGLREDQRKVIEFRIIKGYSVAETARLLGKTEAAVRTAQYRAVQILAGLLDENKETGVIRK
jgi:RNA polymerase sigma-70 factor (ECF subfamily)